MRMHTRAFTVVGSSCTVQFMYEGYDGPSLKAAAGNLTQNRSSTDNVPALTPIACGLHKGIETLAAGSYVELTPGIRPNANQPSEVHLKRVLISCSPHSYSL